MDLQVVHNRVKEALEKESLGYISSSQIDIALDQAQLEEMEELRKAYGARQHISDDLTPFKKTLTFNGNTYVGISNDTVGSGPDGIIVLPSDYLYTTAIRLTTDGVYVEIVNENELADRLGSQLMPPTTSEPIAVLAGKGGTIESTAFSTYFYQLYPQQGMSGYVYYLRRPLAPNFVSTVVNRVEVYDSNASQDLEWNDLATQRIINRAVSILAQPMQATQAIQYHEMKEQKGL